MEKTYSSVLSILAFRCSVLLVWRMLPGLLTRANWQSVEQAPVARCGPFEHLNRSSKLGITHVYQEELVTVIPRAFRQTIPRGQDGDLYSHCINPWPIRGLLNRRQRIRYCFATAEMKEQVKCKFEEAIAVWSDALGGGPGKESGHNLGFAEVTFLGKPQYCFKEFSYNDWKGKRNWKVLDDVLTIYWQDEQRSQGANSATVGYKTKKSPGFRHYMNIADNAPIHAIAHELQIGHVLGMDHEMQRQDRDDYIEFRCIKLVDFNQQLRKYLLAPEPKQSQNDWVNRLCTSEICAESQGFSLTQYMKKYEDISVGQFDVDSIMMYGSTDFSRAQCFQDIEQYPLVKTKKENGVKLGVEEIPQPQKPSKEDVAFVKVNYPWKGNVAPLRHNKKVAFGHKKQHSPVALDPTSPTRQPTYHLPVRLLLQDPTVMAIMPLTGAIAVLVAVIASIASSCPQMPGQRPQRFPPNFQLDSSDPTNMTTRELKTRYSTRIAIWGKAFGKPSKANGHNLAFSEVTSLKKIQLCFTDWDDTKGYGTPNNMVDDDVLRVFFQDTSSNPEAAGGSSTIGYTPEKHVGNHPKAGQHSMTIHRAQMNLRLRMK
ncbi:hypothetical protein BU23DRAFT_565344 [Bimuria novae-zelandiae CBS 107.79]|uniref:Peptidase metallopeptidase domain-containing protein n=1 Tax=Bimuria novae-zelandiae CBS 107.79 TaxID=1447943 RepID=A0A6A5VVG8_9PLEO|nr:hypothetical protein BU23DRAFT_565344 [Bimuria novae-zelandiae CBS 107.79]